MNEYKKAVRVQLLPDLHVFLPAQKVEADVTYKEWILPEEAVKALIHDAEVAIYDKIIAAISKQFDSYVPASAVIDYLQYLQTELVYMYEK